MLILPYPPFTAHEEFRMSLGFGFPWNLGTSWLGAIGFGIGVSSMTCHIRHDEPFWLWVPYWWLSPCFGFGVIFPAPTDSHGHGHGRYWRGRLSNMKKSVKMIFNIPARIFDFTTPNIEYSFMDIFYIRNSDIYICPNIEYRNCRIPHIRYSGSEEYQNIKYRMYKMTKKPVTLKIGGTSKPPFSNLWRSALRNFEFMDIQY